MKVLKTTRKIQYNPIKSDLGDYIVFSILPHDVKLNYVTKEISVELSSFIIKEEVDIIPLYNEDGSPKLREGGLHDFEEKTIDVLTPIETLGKLGGKFTSAEVEEVRNILISSGVITGGDDLLTSLNKCLVYGMKIKLVSDDTINLTSSDLEEYDLK